MTQINQPKVPHQFGYVTLACLYASNCVGFSEQLFYILVATTYLILALD